MPNMIAFQCPSPLDFLQYVIKNHAGPSTVVLCSTREAFLGDIHSAISEPAIEEAYFPVDQESPRRRHPLLTPTIHLLAKSRTIKLAFTPTLQHLRAYLAFVCAGTPEVRDGPAFTASALQSPMLAILGLVDIHRTSSEFSAQGLSRTLSVAVEAAAALERDLVIAEISPAIDDEDAMAENEDQDEASPDLWMEQIPILNGSIKAANSDRAWAGRTVDVGRVVGRWCRIVRVDEDEDS